jgi:hypothetical protein
MGELKVLYKGKWICYLINTDAEDHIIDDCVQLILRDYPKDAEIDWNDNPYISPFTTVEELINAN